MRHTFSRFTFRLIIQGKSEDSPQTRNHLSRHHIQIKHTERDNSCLSPSSPAISLPVPEFAVFHAKLDLAFKSTFELIKTQTRRGKTRQLGVSLSLLRGKTRPDSPISPSVSLSRAFSRVLSLCPSRRANPSHWKHSALLLRPLHPSHAEWISCPFVSPPSPSVSLLLSTPCRCIPIASALPPPTVEWIFRVPFLRRCFLISFSSQWVVVELNRAQQPALLQAKKGFGRWSLLPSAHSASPLCVSLFSSVAHGKDDCARARSREDSFLNLSWDNRLGVII